ncbi:MAG: ATP-binding cassette domain-containing protein [Lachnospiraceae bacterium]|jgi:oligopeptide transport system ATP-binding protein|nr:ATP-binding cassette domain-containing protein [Lachnospiraceae bacterium]MCI1726148.1 ATP-binding cassette domain-containing protein [Lachnospiraceae bacterium]
MENETNRKPLLHVENLCKYFQITKHETLKAVDGISFDIFKGETLGVVGESGCGKSTLGRCIVRLYKPTSGKIEYDGQDITTLKNRAEELNYCKRVQMIFQNPYSSLNPRMTVLDTVGEGIRLYHKDYNRQQVSDAVEELLEKVGLGRDHISRFMHEFSGGQKQRIGIARALSVNPEFIVCDEPISALDVSIQAQVINMLKHLQKDMGLTYMFIAHDLSMVKYISDRIVVMYLGSVMEECSARVLYEHPLHPYTQGLLSAIPEPDPIRAKQAKDIIKGEIPSPINPKPYCKFAGRCPFVEPICRQSIPELREIEPGHLIACHLAEKMKGEKA